MSNNPDNKKLKRLWRPIFKYVLSHFPQIDATLHLNRGVIERSIEIMSTK